MKTYELATCKHCGEKIYLNTIISSWLHLAGGTVHCRTPRAHPEPGTIRDVREDELERISRDPGQERSLAGPRAHPQWCTFIG